MVKFTKIVPASGIIVSSAIGLSGYFICQFLNYPGVDPLLVSLCLGIFARMFLKNTVAHNQGFNIAVRFFIPVGICLYGLRNLNFATVTRLDAKIVFLLIIVLCAYFITVLIAGKLLRQKESITYLTASGSAICGASAITITSSAIDANPDDISISMISVTIAGLFATFILIPFFAAIFNMQNDVYAVFTGSILQFTGFVKSAVTDIPFLRKRISQEDMISLALTVKTTRYLALLISVPLFASLIRRRIVIPQTLIIFLSAGLIGYFLSIYAGPFYGCRILPLVKSAYSVLWSIAMAAVGLDTDIRRFLSNNGTIGLIMAFAGLSTAIGVFFIGFCLIN